MHILDTNNYRVLKWPVGDTFGTVVVNGRGAGSTLDKIGVSYALCLDTQNNIYVSEAGNHRVTKWISGNNTVGQLVKDSFSLSRSLSDFNFDLFFFDKRLLVSQYLVVLPIDLTVREESMSMLVLHYLLSIEEIIVFNDGYRVSLLSVFRNIVQCDSFL